ncbi:hypothetical protein [Methylobacterium sp. E-045]|uniref:hypothetical protein n=1 Tax=Methylobacterium sp. E-045 TaxID=2836575 RepID=UPI001FBBCFE4|nr:hypothetical protein [Methylobacterium sp. E-045]MCJ2127513.1 hypothetical protein [Methylobacterium sp. E-045]
MIRSVGGVLSLVLALTAAAAASQAAEPWQKMVYSDPRHPSEFTPLVAPLWQREIAGKPFHQIHAARFEAGGQTYLVSIVFAGEICSMGANGRNAVAEPAICPARVDLLQDGKVVRTTRGKACSVSPMPEDETGNQADATQVRLDPVARTVAFRSLMAGKSVRACQRTLRLP